MHEWLSMGGNARFVWPSYGVTLLVMWLNIRWARKAARAGRAEAKRRLAMQRSEP
ncbi:MAG: heme exporter protein CcmD [Steroidobacteraceae bacterium]|jgi:heme exporter protein CcmD